MYVTMTLPCSRTRPHKGSHIVGGTQWYALSAADMSLVVWHGAQSNGRYAARTASIVAARE